MKDLKIPNHVGIILDGNGRWAEKRGLKRSEGHKAGYENLKKLSIHILNSGVKYLSLYVFSTENFKRSEEEVGYLMNLFVNKFKKDSNFFKDNNIKVIFSGTKNNLRDDVINAIDYLINETKDNKAGILNICLNYGSRQEIVDMTKKIASKVLNKEIKIDKITDDIIRDNLYNSLPDIDFLIRTSGELRLSNFMLWQLSYAELYFPNTYFPDFNEEEFDNALLVFNKRERRFGGNKKDK